MGATASISAGLTEAQAARLNTALVLVPPSSVCFEVASKLLASSGCRVTGTAVVPAPRATMRHHLHSFAKAALVTTPAELELTEAAHALFAEQFGVSWAACLSAGLVLNAAQMAATNQRAAAPAEGMPVVQLADGLDVTHFAADLEVLEDGSGPAKADTFVVNASIESHLRRMAFVGQVDAAAAEAERATRVFQIAWDPEQTSWTALRSSLCEGPSSLAGFLSASHAALGLAAPPSPRTALVHMSEGPLQAMLERRVWLPESKLRDDPLASRALFGGCDELALTLLLTNPPIDLPGYPTGHAFEITRGMETGPAVEFCIAYAKLKPAPPRALRQEPVESEIGWDGDDSSSDSDDGEGETLSEKLPHYLRPVDA